MQAISAEEYNEMVQDALQRIKAENKPLDLTPISKHAKDVFREHFPKATVKGSVKQVEHFMRLLISLYNVEVFIPYGQKHPDELQRLAASIIERAKKEHGDE